LALIGAFLFSAATSSQRHANLLRRLQGLQAQDVMEAPTTTLAQTRTVETTAGAAEALELLDEPAVSQVLVMVDHRVVGQITRRTLRRHEEAQRRRARTGGSLSGLRRGMLQ
jgi:predicted transcriptional regulator